jgi:hypothetical protein
MKYLWRSQCPLWVNRDALADGRSLSIYPDNRTLPDFGGTSQTCRKRTSGTLPNRSKVR